MAEVPSVTFAYKRPEDRSGKFLEVLLRISFCRALHLLRLVALFQLGPSGQRGLWQDRGPLLELAYLASASKHQEEGSREEHRRQTWRTLR